MEQRTWGRCGAQRRGQCCRAPRNTHLPMQSYNLAESYLPMTTASNQVSRPSLFASFSHLAFARLRCAWLLVCVGLVGCAPDDAIRQYTVPKDGSLASKGAGTPQEILAAIVPGDEAWFFKLMGEPQKIDLYKDDFRQLVSSLSFSPEGKPTWKLPEQWREEPGSDFIYRSLFPPSEKDLKITVSKLAMPLDPAQMDEGSWRTYVVANVNRWRGQLQLSPQEWEEMARDLEPLDKLSKAAAPAYFVSLRGSASGNAMGPMQAGGSSATPRPAVSAPGGKPPSKDDIELTLPEGWRDVPPLSIMAFKSYQVDGPDGTKADVTFTSAGGDRVSNVARWNGQVRGAEDQVAKALEQAEQLTINGAPTEVVTLVGADAEPQAIMAAKIDWSSQESLFVKMIGPAKAVQAHRDAFMSLVKSLTW